MWCARNVFRCFRALERFGDKLTGAAGPFFVTFAAVLLTLGVFIFFEVIQPMLRWQILSLPLNLLIAFNVLAQYYLACTVKPGFIDDPAPTEGHGWIWAKKRDGSQTMSTVNGNLGVRWSEDLNMTKANVTRCRKCKLLRPERAHHCRICNRCVLKYDHHCPVRINQCVGVYNERHFILFMAYLVLASIFFAFLGYRKVMDAMGFTYSEWNYWTPPFLYTLIFILACVMSFAVGVMLAWHLWAISFGETSVEGHDHEVYRQRAKERGDTFENSYDLGKRRNLELFFNVGRDGYPLYSLLFPYRAMPYTNGRTWARRTGLTSHKGIFPGEELTDSDGEEYGP